MQLESVIPWGRSFEEYCRMFNLSDRELALTILGCADGPASFNAEQSARDGKVVSVDPIYQFSRKEIAQRVEAVYPLVMRELQNNRTHFIWEEFTDEEAVGRARMQAMQQFLNDYDEGIAGARYIGASLPFLPFEAGTFQLALCSHFLFLYTDLLDETAHLKAVKELCRVADEVRIYPLVDLNAKPSPHLPAVIHAMENYGIPCRLETVSYRFQKNANEMLVLGSAS